MTSAMMALFATDFAGFGWALMSRILDISVFWVVFVMERIVPCSKVLPPPDLGKSVCVSAGIQNITMSNIFNNVRYSDKQSFRKEVIRMPQPVIVRLPNQMSVLLRARRKYLRITQKDVAFRLGITQPRVSYLEHHPQAISLEQLMRWLWLLDIDLALWPRERQEHVETER